MATKNNKKGPLGQDPSHMGNPMKAFREGGQKRMAAYKKGGYNVPTNGLPKKFMGGPDDPIPPSQGGNSGLIMNPYAIKKPNVPSVNMGNPFIKDNGLNSALNYKPSTISRPVVTAPVASTSTAVTAPVTTTPTVTPAPLSFKEQRRAMKQQGKLDRLKAKDELKKAKIENLKKQYESGEKKAASTGDKIDRAIKVGETVIEGINAVNQFRKPMGGGDSGFKKGGLIKTKTSLMKKKMGGSLMSKKRK